MKNTINIALSLPAIKQNILAECAWVDATNLATLPPIINPTENQDIEKMILASITVFCTRFSGYIASTRQDEDIYHIEMSFIPNTACFQRNLTRFIEEFVVCQLFANAYAPQKQAQHITSMYHDRLTAIIRSITHSLALYAA